MKHDPRNHTNTNGVTYGYDKYALSKMKNGSFKARHFPLGLLLIRCWFVLGNVDLGAVG